MTINKTSVDTEPAARPVGGPLPKHVQGDFLDRGRFSDEVLRT